MGAEGREPSGEDRSWKLGDRRSEMGDRDALTRRGKRRFEISGFFRHLTLDIRHCTERLRFLCGLLFDIRSVFRVFRVFRGSCLGRYWASRLKAELRTSGTQGVGDRRSELGDRNARTGVFAGGCRPESGNKFPHSIGGFAAAKQGPKRRIPLARAACLYGGRASAYKLEAQASGSVKDPTTDGT